MTQTIEPTEVIAGDTVSWTRTLADYSAADSWVLSYTLINATSKISITGSASGSDHLISVAAATTANWTAGTYSWQAYVTKASERHTVGNGTMAVRPNMAAASTLDNRSHVKKTLDAIEAVIENRASMDQEEYSIRGRSLKRTPLADLMKLRAEYQKFYKQELAAEALNQGLAGKNRLYVRL